MYLHQNIESILRQHLIFKSINTILKVISRKITSSNYISYCEDKARTSFTGSVLKIIIIRTPCITPAIGPHP